MLFHNSIKLLTPPGDLKQRIAWGLVGTVGASDWGSGEILLMDWFNYVLSIETSTYSVVSWENEHKCLS